jgi:hypothetical protein
VNEIAMLVKMTDDALRHAMLIYPSHNLKCGLCIKASHLVLVLETCNVERDPQQLSHAEFSLISSIVTTPNDDKIGGIAKAGDVVFLKLDLSNTVIETEILVRTSFQYQTFSTSSDNSGKKVAKSISCSMRPEINLCAGVDIQSTWGAPDNQAQLLASLIMWLLNIAIQQEQIVEHYHEMLTFLDWGVLGASKLITGSLDMLTDLVKWFNLLAIVVPH